MKRSGQFGQTATLNDKDGTEESKNLRPITTRNTAKKRTDEKDDYDEEDGDSYDYDDEVSYYSDDRDGDEAEEEIKEQLEFDDGLEYTPNKNSSFLITDVKEPDASKKAIEKRSSSLINEKIDSSRIINKTIEEPSSKGIKLISQTND